MIEYPSFKLVDAWRHRTATNYDNTDNPRAWSHELQRGAPSGGVVYPTGWWADGSAYQPNVEYRGVPTERWLLIADRLGR